ncbi:FliM/FliN family flagellar motor C-terminal domain-containing protein [Chitinimonas sp. BJB300]|uniref:FliM/FliN family flagellar motor C-terminal domain-containing protein n=1 Tax=Chitinimonas sp. BJB300 TaxID=1559339 RepID=UPI000C0D617F|nr:FliM/FliN family flagellar motor C-terminal domain-containing protein [Chitinimonas sp. BJB300]PHV12867.1 hypothetical protein CSQ89_03490 [Chitinimonas sp. BJB300]TSJ86101.1 FliM/FliN family flagellar motor switch protein [Chitinimonas sp. BJB300]
MEVREYCLLGEAALEAAKGMVITALQFWQSQWGGALPLQTLQLRPASPTVIEQYPTSWRLYSADGKDIAWVRAPKGLARSCEQLLFAEQRAIPELAQHNDSHLAPPVAALAGDALLLALTGVAAADKPVPGSVVTPPASLFNTGSGAIWLEWSLVPGEPLQVIYPCLVRPRRLRRSTNVLTSFHTAVKHQRIHLQVDLGEAELSLGQLQSLQVGDVVRLDRHLGDALNIHDTQGRLVCHGQPGQRLGWRAIEVHKLK